MAATEPTAPEPTAPEPGSTEVTLDPEDVKLLVLARSAAARAAAGGAAGGVTGTWPGASGSPSGAAVRDGDGRTYLSGPVVVGPLRLGAVEAAVAQAAGSGARRLEAVAVVGDEQPDPALLAAVGDPVVVRA